MNTLCSYERALCRHNVIQYKTKCPTYYGQTVNDKAEILFLFFDIIV